MKEAKTFICKKFSTDICDELCNSQVAVIVNMYKSSVTLEWRKPASIYCGEASGLESIAALLALIPKAIEFKKQLDSMTTEQLDKIAG